VEGGTARLLTRIHLHDGNYYAALRDYRAFRSRIQRELGIAPSSQIQALVLLRLAAQPSSVRT
jgi:DNA-binding SARP family transcriptional activator